MHGVRLRGRGLRGRPAAPGAAGPALPAAREGRGWLHGVCVGGGVEGATDLARRGLCERVRVAPGELAVRGAAGAGDGAGGAAVLGSVFAEGVAEHAERVLVRDAGCAADGLRAGDRRGGGAVAGARGVAEPLHGRYAHARP